MRARFTYYAGHRGGAHFAAFRGEVPFANPDHLLRRWDDISPPAFYQLFNDGGWVHIEFFMGQLGEDYIEITKERAQALLDRWKREGRMPAETTLDSRPDAR